MRELESPLRLLLTVGIGAAAFMGAFRTLSTETPRPTPIAAPPPVFEAEYAAIRAHPGEDPIGLLEAAIADAGFAKNLEAASSTEPLKHVERVVIVGLPGTSAPDLIEYRRRTRFAIHRAALDHDFQLKQAEHLSVGYFRHPTEKRNVPFLYEIIEGARATAATTDEAQGGALVWVRYEDFGERPIEGLRTLARRFFAADPAEAAAGTAKPRAPQVFLVGPPYSDHLIQLAREAAANWHTPQAHEPLRVQLLSPWATVSPEVIFDQSKPKPDGTAEQPTDLKALLEREGFVWTPIAYSDGMLIELLRAELAARVLPERRPIRLLLVHEGSSYGQFWGNKGYWQDGCEPELRAQLETWGAKQADFEVVGSVQFERGLDGGAAAAGNAVAAPDAADDPLGADQLDYYLRRFELVNRGQSIFPSADEPHAIGVFATDVYDKLLLIRILNAAFPRAIIFTTDFDERLSLRSELPHTRNLVVASQYGPTGLRARLTGAGSAGQSWLWRDWVQEASYLAAVMTMPKVKEAEAAMAEAPAFPFLRLYEVGNRGVVPLRFRPAGVDDSADEIRQRGDDLFLFRMVTVSLILATWALALRVYASMAKLKHRSPRQILRDRLIVCAIALMGTAAFLVSHWVIGRSLTEPYTEPFAWRDGVSVWPTLTIRLFATVLLLYGLVLAWVHGKLAGLTPSLTSSVGIALLFTGIYGGFTLWVQRYGGFPVPPTRGIVSDLWLKASTYLGVMVLAFLIFLAGRYTQLAWRRIVQFRRQWELGIAEGAPGWTRRFVEELDEMGRMSAYVTRAVWIPATAFGLLFLARWRALDDFQWNTWIVLSILVPALFLLGYLVFLRVHAAQTRRYLLSTISLCGCAKAADGAARDELSGAKDLLTDYKRGAFRPLSEDPIIAAILIPLTMLGGSGWLGSMGVFMG